MAILGENNIRIQVFGHQGLARCVTTLDYFWVTGQYAVGSLDDIAGVFLTDVIPVWQAAVSEAFHFDSVKVAVFGPAPDDVYEVPFVAQGTITGEALPAFVTMRILKFPLNTAIEPISADPFETGRIAISGVPEGGQSNGFLTSAQHTVLQALATELLVLPDVFEDGDLQLFMSRYILENGVVIEDTVAPVISMSASAKLGTQNTRTT